MRYVLFLCLWLFSFLLTWCTIPFFSDSTTKEINALIDLWSRDKAQQMLDTWLAEEPNDMTLLHAQFSLFRKQKKWDDATTIRTLLSPKKQKSTEYEYVIALMRSWKPDNALPIIEQNLSDNIQWARWYELQWQARYLQEKYPESIIAFDKALSLDPLLENAIINKALALADNGKLNESLLLLDAALQNNPDNALLRYNKWTVLSNLWYQQRLWLGTWSFSYYADALRHFEKAYALDQSDTNTIIWLWITYLDLGEYEKAHTVFSVALSNNEHLYDARYYQWKTFLAEWKLQDAKKSFTKLLTLNPEYELAGSELMSIEEQEKLLEQE
jgi:tetratricopeptide (TPR) repeat protein